MEAPRAPLLCRIGWHAPLPRPAWNDGYYFSRCRRCGADLIRTTYSGWEVPRGYRVVWRVDAPDAVEPQRPRASTRAARASAGPTARPSSPRKPSSIPDFMDEAPAPEPSHIDVLAPPAQRRRLPPR